MTLPELIEALEHAEGPSRKLDAEISAATGVVGTFHPKEYTSPPVFRAHGDRVMAFIVVGDKEYRIADRSPEHFTASLDAALTLVPQDMPAMVQRNVPKGYYIVPIGCALIGRSNKLPGRDTMQRGEGATPALALCVAALRARLSAPKEGE